LVTIEDANNKKNRNLFLLKDSIMDQLLCFSKIMRIFVENLRKRRGVFDPSFCFHSPEGRWI
jgi:hypothetical protein